MADPSHPGGAEGLRRRWQIQILATTWLAYFGYYFCRKAFYVVKDAMGMELDFSPVDLAHIGTAYLVLYYLALLQGPVERIRGEIRDLQRARASIERVEELLRTRHRHTRPRLVERGTARLPGGPLAVALEEVTFRYAAGAADDGADDGVRDMAADGG